MSYFLKKTKINDRIYIQISKTTYNKETKKSSNKCYRKIGYLDQLRSKNGKDPLVELQKEVNNLNKQSERAKKERENSSLLDAQILNAGHIIIKGLLNKLKIEEELKRFCVEHNETPELYDVFEAMLFARAVFYENDSIITYDVAFKNLYGVKDYSKKEILRTLSFFGEHYFKITEILVKQINKVFKCDKKHAYFDSTYLFFETSDNKEFEQMFILNDDGIPCGLSLRTMDSSRLTVIKQMIQFVNANMPGTRYIGVSNRSFNYQNNIYNSLLYNYGYILPVKFSSLGEKDKEWLFNNDNYNDILNTQGETQYKIKSEIIERPTQLEKNDGELIVTKIKQKRIGTIDLNLTEKKRLQILSLVDEAKTLFHLNAKKEDYSKSQKYIKVTKTNDGKNKIDINNNRITNDLKYAGYKMLLSSEFDLDEKNIFHIYDIVWKIESYFKYLKTQISLDKDFLKTTEIINGHLLLSYFIVTVFQLLTVKILKNNLTINQMMNFNENFKLTNFDNGYINITKDSDLIRQLKTNFNIPVDKRFFTKKELDNLMKKSF